MRTSTEPAPSTLQPIGLLKDEQPADWHPARISDRKLQQLQSRLEMLRRLGGSFASVEFSDQAKQRLAELG